MEKSSCGKLLLLIRVIAGSSSGMLPSILGKQAGYKNTSGTASKKVFHAGFVYGVGNGTSDYCAGLWIWLFLR